MTSSSRPRLIAAFVACLTLAAQAHAQFDFFHHQSTPPANVPGGGAENPDEAAQLVVRVNQLEEALRQANGRIEELENAQHRLEEQVQKFRQDVEFRFGDRSEGAPPEPDVAEAPCGPGPAGRPCKAEAVRRIRSQRRSERARSAAAAGNHVAERPACARIARAFGA